MRDSTHATYFISSSDKRTKEPWRGGSSKVIIRVSRQQSELGAHKGHNFSPHRHRQPQAVLHNDLRGVRISGENTAVRQRWLLLAAPFDTYAYDSLQTG